MMSTVKGWTDQRGNGRRDRAESVEEIAEKTRTVVYAVVEI